MKKVQLSTGILTFFASIMLTLSTGCDGMYVGVGSDMSVPGGALSVNVGTTVPLNPPIVSGLPGYGPVPVWNHGPHWAMAPGGWGHRQGWGGSFRPGWGHGGPQPGPGNTAFGPPF